MPIPIFPLPQQRPATAVLIVKIFRLDEWQNFQSQGYFKGSSDDQRDGYIHLSSRTQLMTTLLKYFRDAKTIIIAAFNSHDLEGEKLLWEPSREGQLFPHSYSPLAYENIIAHIILNNPLDSRAQIQIERFLEKAEQTLLKELS